MVEGVTVLDPLEAGPPRGQVALAVGVDPHTAAAVDVVREAAGPGAAAVVFGPRGDPRTGRTTAARARF